MYNKLSKVVAPLGGKPKRVRKHFDVYYEFRNPAAHGPGLGLMGIDRLELIDRYEAAVERVYALLADREEWTPPAGRLRVYVFDTTRWWQNGRDAPFTYPDKYDGPVIGLRSVLNEPDREAMLARAEVEAAHETAHTFNHVHHPPSAQHSPSEKSPWRYDPWKWFDEATAVFMERQACDGHHEGLRFAIHWAYQPELVLESPHSPGGYSAAWFVEYLVETFGWGFLRAVWHDRSGDRRERPVHVINRLLGGFPGPSGQLTFAEVFAGEGRADPQERARRQADKRLAREKARRRGCDPAPGCCCAGDDAGRHPIDLCDDNYCTRSYSVHCFAGRVHDRFGGRSVAERLDVPAGGSAGVRMADPLGPLSCRYFQLYPGRDCRSVRVRVSVAAPSPACRLRVAVMPLAGTFQLGHTVHLPPRPDAGGTGTVFEGHVGFPPLAGGHLVLVVSNVYVVPPRKEPDPAADFQTCDLTAVGSADPVPDAAPAAAPAGPACPVAG